MDSSEVSSEDNKEKKESIFKYSIGLTLIFLSIAIIFLFLRLTGALDTNQYMTLLLTDAFLFVSSLSLILSSKQLSVSKLQESAARESIHATKKQIIATVQPYLHFLIRPQSHFKDPSITFSREKWVPGVGIYVENLGSGPAIDYKISCKIIAKDESTRSCEKSFVGSRLLPGQRYSYPSTDWDEPRIQIDDEKITIETEYKDRLGNHHQQEPIEIEIDKLFFAHAQITV